MSRREHDFLGEVEIPDTAYYGAQTFRALQNFDFTGQRLCAYPIFVNALAKVKKACILANNELGFISEAQKDAVVKACDRIIKGELHDQFVVDMIQGGAGTSTNMNANEVITNLALEIMGHKKGEYQYLHPNDHLNFAQSTNDAYPCAIHIAIDEYMVEAIAALKGLVEKINKKAKEFKNEVKMGRTHLQDAVPMTLGQEFKGWADTLEQELAHLEAARSEVLGMNLGATAVGTGINAHPDYAKAAQKYLREVTGRPFTTEKDLVAATSDTSPYVFASAMLKKLALKLIKITNDMRLLTSGPRTAIGEINLPKMQPGSSIMPGKVNPVIPEVTAQVCYAVIGNDITVSLGAENGQLQLNVMEPVIAWALFNSAHMITNAMNTLGERCVVGIEANSKRCIDLVMNSVGIVTALNPHIGYEASAAIAKEALASGKSVYELALATGKIKEAELKKILDPKNMLKSSVSAEDVKHRDALKAGGKDGGCCMK